MPHPHKGGGGGYGQVGGTLTVHVGDTHVGSSVAVCPPRVPLEDGGYYYASKDQLWYWKCWCEFWADTMRLKKKLGARVLAIFGGDLRDGDHHETTQLWAANELTQDRAVLQVLAVAEPVIDAAVFVRGTQAHSGPDSVAEERYAWVLDKRGWTIWGNGRNYSHWIWTAEVEGVRLQEKHQPGTRSRVRHTRDLSASRQAQYTWEEYSGAGIPPPDVIVFHHVHYRARGYYNDTYCHYVPSWQTPTNWVNNILSSPVVEWPGGLRLHLKDGTYTTHELRFKPESSVAWMK